MGKGCANKNGEKIDFEAIVFKPQNSAAGAGGWRTLLYVCD